MIDQPSLFDERAAPTVGTLNAIVLEIISDGSMENAVGDMRHYFACLSR